MRNPVAACELGIQARDATNNPNRKVEENGRSKRRDTRIANEVVWRPPCRPGMSARAAAAPAAALCAGAGAAHNALLRSIVVTVVLILSASAIAAAPAAPILRSAAAAAPSHRERRPPPRPSADRAQRTPQVNLRERFVQELGPHAPQRSLQIRARHGLSRTRQSRAHCISYSESGPDYSICGLPQG